MDYKFATIEYIEGRIKPKEFELMIESDQELNDFLNGLAPEDRQLSEYIVEKKCFVKHPYSIRTFMRLHESLDEGGPKGSPSYHYHIHREISRLIANVFPDISLTPDSSLETIYYLALTATPDYIGGKEVAEANVIGGILEKIPQNLSKTKLQKEAKTQIKAAFHIEGRKRPYWLQPPEWPVNNGVPLRYLKTVKKNPEFVQHYFEDVSTGQIRVVDDFY